MSAAIAHDLLRLVEENGGSREAVIRDACLGHIGGSLLDPVRIAQSLSHDDFTRLYAHSTWLLDHHAARQEGREPLTKAGFGMLCHCVISCRTLRETIQRADQFSALLGPRLARLELKVEDDYATLTMSTARQIRNGCAYLSDLTGLSTYHRLFGWLIGEDIPLLGAAMRYSALLDQRTAYYLMPCPIRHNAAENSIRFSAVYLDRRVIRSPSELVHLLEYFPFDMETALSIESPLSERISHLFDAALTNGERLPQAPLLARQFGISLATLKRRLITEGTTIVRLKAKARLALATKLLDDPRLTVTEVARRSGFSDIGAFRRAFHQWTGQSPTAWRKGHLRT